MADTATVTSPNSEPSRPAASPAFGWRLISVLGEILITLGVLLLLLVVYELWWTNVTADQQATEQREELLNTWREAAPTGPTTVELPAIPSEAFGLMYIPRLQSDVWATPLIEGVDDADLSKGIGHFTEAAMPGEIGNAAFAGHRATHGEPLANVDQLQAGDMVYIETATGWYSYTLMHDELVMPTDVWVTDPVPGEPVGTEPTHAVLTLITCHPRWGSTQRWVWWGELTEARSKDQGPPTEVVNLAGGA